MIAGTRDGRYTIVAIRKMQGSFVGIIQVSTFNLHFFFSIPHILLNSPHSTQTNILNTAEYILDILVFV